MEGTDCSLKKIKQDSLDLKRTDFHYIGDLSNLADIFMNLSLKFLTSHAFFNATFSKEYSKCLLKHRSLNSVHWESLSHTVNWTKCVTLKFL